MNMRERLVRALCEEDRLKWDSVEHMHSEYFSKVDTILTELETPTPEMVEAMWDKFGAMSSDASGPPKMFETAFTAAIRAIKEGK